MVKCINTYGIIELGYNYSFGVIYRLSFKENDIITYEQRELYKNEIYDIVYNLNDQDLSFNYVQCLNPWIKNKIVKIKMLTCNFIKFCNMIESCPNHTITIDLNNPDENVDIFELALFFIDFTAINKKFNTFKEHKNYILSFMQGQNISYIKLINLIINKFVKPLYKEI